MPLKDAELLAEGGSAARGWAGLFSTSWISDNVAGMVIPRLDPTHSQLMQQPVGSDVIEASTRFAIASFGAFLSAKIGTEKRLRSCVLRTRALEPGAA
jgi:hypothetical protein